MTRRTSRKRSSLRRNAAPVTYPTKRLALASVGLDDTISLQWRASARGVRPVSSRARLPDGRFIVLYTNLPHDASVYYTVETGVSASDGSLRRNSSAEDTALDLIAHAEAATKPYDFDATTASEALDELTRWKSRHGAWPFPASRYWRVVDALHARQAEHPSLRRNSATSKSWQGKMGLSSADTEMSVRREIASAEKARVRALEALEHAVFVDKVSKDEERYFKDALERANAKQFQARIKLSSLGLRKNSRKLRRNGRRTSRRLPHRRRRLS